MTTEDHAERGIARLVAVFGDPRTPDAAQYLDEVARVLATYNTAELIPRIVDRAIDECTFFPKPAELLAYARDAAHTLELLNRKPVRPRLVE